MTTAPMTLSDLLDWHAWRLGWERSPDGIWSKPEWGDKHVRAIRAGCLPRLDHPCPLNLDAIADLLPPGWWWSRYGADLWWKAGHKDSGACVRTADTGDEKHDRAWLAKLAWEQEADRGKA